MTLFQLFHVLYFTEKQVYFKIMKKKTKTNSLSASISTKTWRRWSRRLGVKSKHNRLFTYVRRRNKWMWIDGWSVWPPGQFDQSEITIKEYINFFHTIVLPSINILLCIYVFCISMKITSLQQLVSVASPSSVFCGCSTDLILCSQPLRPMLQVLLLQLPTCNFLLFLVVGCW